MTTITRFDAVVSLVGGGLVGNDEASKVNYIDGQTPPSDAEIDTEVKRLQAEYDAQEYARNRASAFPSIGDQMDMQYHDLLNSTTTWQDAVAKVKSDNPK